MCPYIHPYETIQSDNSQTITTFVCGCIKHIGFAVFLSQVKIESGSKFTWLPDQVKVSPGYSPVDYYLVVLTRNQGKSMLILVVHWHAIKKSRPGFSMF